MIQFIVALWIFFLLMQLAAWAWPVTLGLFGLAIIGSLLSLAGRRGRIMRRRAEGRMWEEFGRHMRGEGK